MSVLDLKLDLPFASSRREKAILFLATGFYLSLIPPKIASWVKLQPWSQGRIRPNWTGSGISGAVLGLFTYLLLPRVVAANVISLIVGTLLAVWVSHHAEKILGHHDDSRIVIDEWIGCWFAMVGLPPLYGLPHHFGIEVITAFIFFRVFDVFKGPWGNWLQKLPGGWGVVMDDVVAGLIANIVARIVVVFIGVL